MNPSSYGAPQPQRRVVDWDAFMRTCQPPADAPPFDSLLLGTSEWAPNDPAVLLELVALGVRLGLPILARNPLWSSTVYQVWNDFASAAEAADPMQLRRWYDATRSLVQSYNFRPYDRTLYARLAALGEEIPGSLVDVRDTGEVPPPGTTPEQWAYAGAINTLAYQVGPLMEYVNAWVPGPTQEARVPHAAAWIDTLGPVFWNIADAVTLTLDPLGEYEGVWSDFSDYPVQQEVTTNRAFLQRWWELVQCRFPVRRFPDTLVDVQTPWWGPLPDTEPEE